MSNPIQYTSRSFQTILADINADAELADKPEWFKRMIAGIGDVMSMCLDAQANNSYLESAFTRDAVKKMCQLIGYTLGVKTTSVGKLKFYFNNNTVFPITITKNDLRAMYKNLLPFGARTDITCQTTTRLVYNAYEGNDHLRVSTQVAETLGYETYDKVYISDTSSVPTGFYYLKVVKQQDDYVDIYFADSMDHFRQGIWQYIAQYATLTIDGVYNATVECYQQEQKPVVMIGESDGNTPWQSFILPDKDVLQDTLEVTINDETWTRVDDFAHSTNQSRHFRLDYNNDDTSKIVFGNGTYGAIPSNFPIYVTYAVGGGSDTNINSEGVVNAFAYVGGSSDIESVINSTSFSGGMDAESIESAKILAPASLKTSDRFITEEDGLLLINRTGVSGIAYIWSNYYGSFSCKVNCVARGGGNLSSTNKQYVQDFLKTRSILGSLYIQVEDTVFTEVDLAISVTLNENVTLEQILPYINICYQLFFSECGKEIVDTYVSSGLEKTVQLINSIFSTDFSLLDLQISNMVQYLQKTGYRVFGETIYASNFITMFMNCISGINSVTILSNIFPLTVPRDSITTPRNITIS